MGFVNLKIQTEKEKYDELKHRGGSRKQSNELEEGAEPAPFYSIHLQTMCSLFRERQGKREEEEEKKSERETETERQRGDNEFGNGETSCCCTCSRRETKE